jgi:RNA recognition motif-containing protein
MVDQVVPQLFVGNLALQTTESELIDIFSLYGKLGSVTIPRSYETGESRQVAFVHYAHAASVDKAIRFLSGAKVNGRPMRIKLAHPPPKSSADEHPAKRPLPDPPVERRSGRFIDRELDLPQRYPPSSPVGPSIPYRPYGPSPYPEYERRMPPLDVGRFRGEDPMGSYRFRRERRVEAPGSSIEALIKLELERRAARPEPESFANDLKRLSKEQLFDYLRHLQ